MYQIVFQAQNSTLALFTHSIGGPNVVAGFAMACLSLAALVSRPIFGFLLDSRGRRLILLLGLVILALTSLFLEWTASAGILLACSVMRGLGFSAGSTASGTMVADQVPHHKMAEGIGYYGIANTLAMALGPSAGIWIARRFDYSKLFLICFIIGLASIGIAIFINYEKKRGHPADGISLQDNPKPKGAFLEKAALRPAVVNLLILIPFSTIITYMPAYAEFLGIKNISFFYMVYALAVLITRTYAGKIGDRNGFAKIVIPHMVLLMISFSVIAFATRLPVLLLGAILFGLGFGTLQPILNAIAIKRSPFGRTGAANATFLAASDIGVGLGAAIWGGILQCLSFNYIYIFSVLVSGIALLAFVFLLMEVNGGIKLRKS